MGAYSHAGGSGRWPSGLDVGDRTGDALCALARSERLRADTEARRFLRPIPVQEAGHAGRGADLYRDVRATLVHARGFVPRARIGKAESAPVGTAKQLLTEPPYPSRGEGERQLAP
jgi:hypothetical protein